MSMNHRVPIPEERESIMVCGYQSSLTGFGAMLWRAPQDFDAIVFASAFQMEPYSATNYVQIRDDLQTAINKAADNETLVIFPDSFGGKTLLVDRPLTLVAAKTNSLVNVVSPVQFTGSGEWHLQQIQFANTVRIQENGAVTAVGCRFVGPVSTVGASLRHLSNDFNASLSVDLTGGSYPNFQAFDSSMWPVTLSGGKALFKRCTIIGYGPEPGFNSSILAHGVIMTYTCFEGIRLTRPCFQNAFASLLAKTGGGFVAPRSPISIFSTASRLAPACFGWRLQTKPF